MDKIITSYPGCWLCVYLNCACHFWCKWLINFLSYLTCFMTFISFFARQLRKRFVLSCQWLNSRRSSLRLFLFRFPSLGQRIYWLSVRCHIQLFGTANIFQKAAIALMLRDFWIDGWSRGLDRAPNQGSFADYHNTLCNSMR